MYTIILGFITAFMITYLAIPSIINVAKEKNLFDEPGERTSHSSSVPTLGGLGIFAGLIFSVTFWTPFSVFSDLQYILCVLITTAAASTSSATALVTTTTTHVFSAAFPCLGDTCEGLGERSFYPMWEIFLSFRSGSHYWRMVPTLERMRRQKQNKKTAALETGPFSLRLRLLVPSGVVLSAV